MKRAIISLINLFAIVVFIQAQVTKDWTIVATYDITGKASGLAWDGASSIYYGIYGVDGDKVYKFNQLSGNSALQFSNPAIDDSYGMTWDGSSIWIIDQPSSSGDPALATQLDLSGNILSTITLPDHYMSGIAYDNGDFWVCTYYPDPGTIYKINSSGTVLTQFQSPGEQPWDICLENGDLWVADYYDHILYKIDVSGNIIESHASDNIKPSGIVYDDNYLWYCDGEISTTPSKLYQVNLGGAGTPAINIPVAFHDYGMITVGNTVVWNMFVSNTGTAPLIISDIEIPPGEPLQLNVFPVVIDPGNSTNIPIYYSPVDPIPLDVTVEVLSNDPVTPSVPVYLSGHGLNEGPSVSTGSTSHDYGLIRQDAHTRWFFDLMNIGDDTLMIINHSSSGDEFYVFQDDPFPKQLGPLESVQVGLWFNPDLPLLYSGNIDLSTNDPANMTISINLEGEGQKKDWYLGEELWQYNIDGGFDNSPKAIDYIDDITYDSIEDVVICSEDNYIRCFNGNAAGEGDVMWEQKIYSGSVYSQHGIDILQANGDDVEDIVIGTTGGDRSIIAMNGKSGEFIWYHQTSEYGDGGWVYQVDASYDYNGDEVIDVLAATGDDSGDTGPKRVYCLDGLSGESIWECYTDGPNFSCLGVKDFTGDGQADAIGGASSNAEDEGRVFGINGVDGSIEWTFIVDGTSVWAIEQLNDITGDGVPDIVVGDGVFSGGNVYYLDAANGTEVHSAFLGHTINNFSILDDINGDSHPDILVAYGGANGVVLSGLDASNIWLQPVADKAWVADAIGDISGDGLKDAIIGTLFTDNYWHCLDGLNGEELSSMNYGSPVDAIRAIPDIVGDHSMEMIVGARDGRVRCYSGGINASTSIDEVLANKSSIHAVCYPNPFSPISGSSTNINYFLDKPGQISLNFYDVQGRVINVQSEGQKQKGLHHVNWDGRDQSGRLLPAGLYFCRISSGTELFTLRITIM